MHPDGPVDRGYRLHPITLAFTIGDSVKTLLLPGLAVLLLTRGHRYEAWLMALFVPVVLYQVFRYLTLTYRFAGTEMIVRTGVVFRQERHIPYDRIDNVGLVQGPLHRLAGVAKVRLETAGSSEPEAELEVLSLAAVEHLRARILAGRTAPPAATTGDPEESPPEIAADSEIILELPTRELVTLGLLSPRGLLLVPVLAGLAYEFDLIERLNVDWLLDAAEAATEHVPGPALAAGVAAAAALVFVGLSVAWTVLRFHGYRLERTGDLLRVTCGLLTRVSATVHRHRIQLVTVHEPVGHRLCGRVTVRVETAGGADEETQVSRKWFVPLLPRAESARVLNELRPGLDLGRVDWQPLARKAGRRKAVKNVALAVTAGAAGVGVLGGWGLVLVPLLGAWAVVHAILWARRTAYALTDDGLVYRTGVLTRQTTATFFDKLQVLALSQSPMDRRHRMAALAADTAGAAPAPVQIPYLDEAVARDLVRTLSAQAEATTPADG